MTLFLIALLAGVLTVLSPCVLPLLPIIVGGSMAGGTSLKRALTVTLALGASVFIFTFLLKVSTALINVPQSFWNIFSGVIIIIVGLLLLFPKLFDLIPGTAKLNQQSNKLMSAGYVKQNFWGDVIVGAALGPVFSTCSPTYFIVLATVLPASLAAGVIDILAYIVGLSFSLLVISLLGQRIMAKLNVAADSNGVFKRVIGVIFIAIGILIITGLSAAIEAPLYNIFDETKIEQGLLQKHMATPTAQMDATGADASSTDAMATTTAAGTALTGSVSVSPLTQAMIMAKAAKYPKETELVKPDGYLNTNGAPITLKQFIGKKVVLVDFWTYSCINCQRTLPYLTTWYGKYKDEGLVIIGVHTPEFAFEHVQANVADALKRFGITYPVVLDNEYQTWNAYGNQFWPHEYLIDIDGYVVHDHIGEGGYAETESAIQAALKERAMRLGMAQSSVSSSLSATSIPEADLSGVRSPETYFGSNRNEYLANGTPETIENANFTLPATTAPNMLYLGGTWNIVQEYATATAVNDQIEYTYSAGNIYFVASADTATKIEITQDGKPLTSANAGADVDPATSTATIHENRLYTLVHNATPGQHTIMIKVLGSGGLHVYTFTFG